MVYRTKTLKIFGNTLVATNNNANDNNIIIVDIEGWDEFPELIRNTSPKLFGDGEYQSTAAQYSKRNISFTLQLINDATIANTILRDTIQTLAAKINDLVAIDMYYYEDNVEVYRERILARPAEPFLEDWDAIENTVTFTLNYTAPDPYKTIYLAGSTTPEATRKL